MPGSRGRRRRAGAAAATAAALAGGLGACTVPGTGEPFRILAGSEIRDLEPLLADAEDVVGGDIEIEYTGTLEGAERIAAGDATDFQAAWFSSNRYLELLPDAAPRIGTSDEVMASPVVLGVRRPVARTLGWDAEAPSWGEIADAAAAGQFTFAMTNPAASNTGFSALAGVATALSGTGSPLTSEDVASVADDLSAFLAGQRLTAGSSGWLADAFVEREGVPGREVDGVVTDESVLLTLNAESATDEPLTLVYPRDGVATVDYPLTFLADTADEDRERFDALVDWLAAPEQQERIVELTQRRPLTPGVAPPPGTTDEVLADLPLPDRPGVATDLVDAYLDEIRRPPQTIFVLDTSESMAGGQIEDLQQSLRDLAGADTSTRGTFARFRGRETVTLVPFGTLPQAPADEDVFVVPATGGDEVLAEISARADDLVAVGDAAVYDSLRLAYEVAGEQLDANPDGDTSVVLLTGGESTVGDTLADFERFHAQLPPPVGAVPTFAVLVGDSDVEEMERVAEVTGGRVFDARDRDLSEAFQDMRGYR